MSTEYDAEETPLDIDDVPDVHNSPAPETAESTAAAAVATRRLPNEFWDTRDMFKTIRQAAWATQTHPDAVLAAVITRASAVIPHTVKFDSGRGPHGSMNLFACILAPSGIGKSEASRCARNLVRLPAQYLDIHGNTDHDKFRDGIGIGSGEGIAEAFMGTRTRDTGQIDKKGNPVEEKYRTQTRHNVFFYVDEGQTLTRLMERQSATLGATIRSAWGAETLGQANATDERNRHVTAGTYSMGLLVGFQPDSAIAMINADEVGMGTPQRFLWFGAQDTEMPEDLYTWPDTITMPNFRDDTTIAFPTEIKQVLKDEVRRKNLGTVEVAALDAHEPLMRCKLAALFAILDNRYTVTREDWALAAMVWHTSCSIRDTLLSFRTQREEQRTEERTKQKVNEQVAVTKAVKLAEHEISDDIIRVATRIARKVHSDGPQVRYLYRKAFGRDKHLFDAGLSYAATQKWVTRTADDTEIHKGTSMPT